MMGILKWGMARIWSCDCELCKFKVETWKLFIPNKEVRANKPGHEENLKLLSTAGVIGHPYNL